MRENVTEGTICLKDDYGLEYKIAKITYIEKEDESFRYVFKPYYNVTDMLSADIFQGIPGLRIENRKEEYVRENIVPTFISERTPGRNRENLWEMLQSVGMTYLNQLEWLIRTDTRYAGDRMYVKRYSNDDEKRTITVDYKSGRMLDMCREVLEIICYGNDVVGQDYEINDANRKEFYKLLHQMYSSEMDVRRKNHINGVRAGASQGHYKGRKRLQLSTPRLYEIKKALATHRMTEEQALKELGISRATLYRRLKEIE